jgi:hypothetical protein
LDAAIIIVLIITVGAYFIANSIYQPKQEDGVKTASPTPSGTLVSVPEVVVSTAFTSTVVTTAQTEVTPNQPPNGDNDVYTYLKGCVIRTTTYPSGSRFIMSRTINSTEGCWGWIEVYSSGKFGRTQTSYGCIMNQNDFTVMKN